MKTKIIASVVSLIALSLISGMVDLLTYRKNPKNYTRSLNRFTMRTSMTMCLYGVISIGIFSFLFIGYFFVANGINEGTASMNIMMLIITGTLLVTGLVCFAGPMPGFWDIVVDGDDITVIKLWIFRKSFKISEIDKVVMKIGDMRVYIKGKKRHAFMVDAMMNGVNNFLKRMDKEGILVEDDRPQANAEKEEYLDKDQEAKITDKNYFISVGVAVLSLIYMIMIRQFISVFLISALIPLVAWGWLECIRYTPHKAEQVYKANKVAGKMSLIGFILFAVFVIVDMIF